MGVVERADDLPGRADDVLHIDGHLLLAHAHPDGLAAHPQAQDGLVGCGLHTHRLDGHIGQNAVGEFRQDRCRVVPLGIDRHIRPQLLGGGQAGVTQVGHDDTGGMFQLDQLEDADADGARPDDEHGLAG